MNNPYGPSLIWRIPLVLLAISLGLYLVIDPKTEANAELTQYCEMVDLSIETRGDYGWPDFKNIYNDRCKS